MKKYVIRHYWEAWADIVVEAESLEEAYDLAHEKYNNGEYKEDPNDFENTEVKDVTGWYEANNLPF